MSSEEDSSSSSASEEQVTTKTLSKKEQRASDKAAKKAKKNEEKAGKKKGGIMLRAKKNMAGKMATSKLGGKAFKKFADDETIELLDLIQNAAAIKESIMKIVVKVILLHQGKELTDDQFGDIIGRFKKMCSLVKNAYRTNLMNGHKGELDEKQVGRLGEIAHEIDELTNKLLSPHLSSNTTNRLTEIINYFRAESFLKFAFADKEFDRVVVILTYYLEQM